MLQESDFVVTAQKRLLQSFVENGTRVHGGPHEDTNTP